MRIKATDEGDETKANTAKIMGNSSYGKLLQNPIKHKNVKLVSNAKIAKYMKKGRKVSQKLLETEEGNYFKLNIILYNRLL